MTCKINDLYNKLMKLPKRELAVLLIESDYYRHELEGEE